ncbi:MAG: cytidine deaminase [Bacteroidales bacterium]|nr:cytidine deaminase [Bacteroidales bacterium]MBD5205200.1 cytidine deaminase [Bacteroidales bacterium]MBD5224149.1 cytidine deaminase [Bacteroidales bacterium]MBD5302813.1 cytidine deaminase [Bacteroides sp.]
MKTHKIETPFEEYAYDELPEADRQLVDTAKDMTRNSYAPYSGFHVGAAILLDNGVIIKGSNQENVAYPSGTCAERTACYQASALHPGVPMRKIAIAAWTNGHFQENPISPCGACRQALAEYEAKYGPIEVILYGEKGIYKLPSVSSLLPFTFTEF